MASYDYEKNCDLDALADEILAGMGYKVMAAAVDDNVNGWLDG